MSHYHAAGALDRVRDGHTT